ncbi:MAG: cytochrome c3 family protein [Nitrospirae bacterium]|nr:cytochrome c3 family protein [Nitrospirota bacterium]
MNNSKPKKIRDPIIKGKRFFFGEIKINALIFLFVVLFLSTPFQLSAKVTGTCANCHTMHNSQGGVNVGAGPNDNLMTTLNGATDACVGCHSASSGATWKDPVTNAPIVWNTSEPTFNTQKGLAGGNFYWVGAGDNSKGHNVYGIAGADSLTTAPGKTPAGCTNSCHTTLAAAPSSQNSNRGGCRGCHVFTFHHEDNGVYRFLKGHGEGASLPIDPASKNITSFPDYVTGVEDNDWEQETAIDHNSYKGTTTIYDTDGSALTTYKTMTAFCSGCHGIFHGNYNDITGRGMGSSTPWRRHPTDIALPTTTEYNGYNPETAYNAEAPVAWTNPSVPARAGAVVMCLSCHRPHGSAQPDMLRWAYSDMDVGTTDPNKAGHGCFVCHTQKDGL